MVESTIQGDGINRPVTYAVWREDQPAQEGYSRELISLQTPKEFVDNHQGMPSWDEKCLTILDYFEKRVSLYPNDDFLGTRAKLAPGADGKPVYGEYTWLTNKEVETTVKRLALAMEHRQLATKTEGDGKEWSFIGIWSKNRREWLETYLANMYFNRTTIGFFDSMGV
jgi:long-chain acyl-CoA synthetase